MRSAWAVVLLAPAVALAASQSPKVDPELWTALERGPQVVIVEVEDPLASDRVPSSDSFSREARTAARRARETDLADRKKRVLSSLASHQELKLRQVWPSFRLFSVEAGAQAVRALAEHREVRHLHFNRIYRPLLESSVPFTGANLLQQKGYRGQGTSVAVVDSPVRYGNGFFGSCPQPGAAGCSVASVENFTQEDPAAVAAGEPHGTNVAGIVLGMAPQTLIHSLNVFFYSPDLNSYVSAIEPEVSALQWVARHAADYDIVAVNMSLGATNPFARACNGDALFDPIRTLWADHNVLVAVASGNDGRRDAISLPSCVSPALAVAAQFDTDLPSWMCRPSTPHAGQVACFSNLSGDEALVAPGVNIDAGGVNGFTGTSMACPHVAGAIAALQSMAAARAGSFESAAALQLRLLSSALPLPYRKSVYAQLHLTDEARFGERIDFPSWFKEDPANRITASPGLSVATTVSGRGSAVGGAYLFLQVIHPKPENVKVSVTAPDGKRATFNLPSGQSDFKGVVGKLIFPGAMSPLRGSPVDGGWTLTLEDGGSNLTGAYLAASLLLVDSGCAPKCSLATCGDDLCGEDCGHCLVDATCYAAGDPAPNLPCQRCDPTVSSSQFTPVSDGSACQISDPCVLESSCVAGQCVPGKLKDCTPLDGCHENGYCDSSTGECRATRKTAGSPCDDGNACTVGDSCRDGVCRGDLASCPQVECRATTSCDAKQGLCVPGAPLPDGTKCSTGTCKSGECRRCGCGSAGGSLFPALGLLGLVLRRRRG